MINGIADLRPLLPEICLLSATLFILMLELFLAERHKGWVHPLATATLLATAYFVSMDFSYDAPRRLFEGLFIRDALSDVLKMFMLLTTAIVFVYGRHSIESRGVRSPNYYLLILFALLGMMVLVSSGNLVTVYLGLELMALSTYALVALERDNGLASEAAMKYFVLGALASGLLLYGMSLLFGLTSSLDLQVIAQKLAVGGVHPVLSAFALVFIVIGLAFKFGAVPFHMWLPDVYEGAPTATTLFIASVPKLAAVGMAFRLLPEGLGPLLERWREMLAILAVGSLVLGNLAAIAQYNIKRMLAYSTISHVGFIFLGLINGTALGYSATVFYAVVYALSTAAAFGVIIYCARDGMEFDKIEDFKGLNQRSPWIAFLMLLVMASLAGFPPLVGFWAKVQVLQSAMALGSQWTWLVLTAAVFAVVGAYYYLYIIKVMYFDGPQNTDKVSAPFDMRLVLSANVLLLLLLGLYWQPLAAICNRIFG